MITKIPITKMRVHLGDIIRRVRVGGERFVIEKDGYPVAGILDIDDFEDLVEMRDKDVRKQIVRSVAEYKEGKVWPAREL